MNAHDPLLLSRTGPRCPNERDRRIGERIVALRTARRITQIALAQVIGVTASQLYKYEVGKSRVGAARLREVADFFEVPVSLFHEELPEGTGLAEIDGLLQAPGAIDALRAFAAIDPEDRAHAVALLCMLARHCPARAPQARADA